MTPRPELVKGLLDLGDLILRKLEFLLNLRVTKDHGALRAAHLAPHPRSALHAWSALTARGALSAADPLAAIPVAGAGLLSVQGLALVEPVGRVDRLRNRGQFKGGRRQKREPLRLVGRRGNGDDSGTGNAEQTDGGQCNG